MARSILSLGMFSTRAAMMAARRRGFMAGSGNPSLADTVISRASFPNSLDLTASWRPLRCMMFLNWEWPAMVLSAEHGPRAMVGAARADRWKSAGVIFRPWGEWKQSPDRRPRLFEPPAEAHGADPAGEAGRVIGLDRDRAQRRRPERRLEAGGRDAPHEPVQRLVLHHADHRIIIAGHADVRDERGAARQHLVIGGWRVGVGWG